MGEGGLTRSGGLAGLQSRGRTDRARTLYFIAAAVLAALIPIILFAGLWMREILDQNERELQAYLSLRTSNLSAHLDAEIAQQFANLKAIASVPSLDGPDLAMFQTTASRMMASIPQWAVIALIEPTTGRQILNSLYPVGADLPTTTAPEVIRQVAEEREPAVSTRYAGQEGLYDRNSILLFVPVIRESAVRYVLMAAMKAEVVQQLLLAVRENELLSVVVDEDDRILARSRGLEDFLGRLASEQLRRSTADRSSGLFVARTRDDQDVFTAFHRSELTGWLSVIESDRQQFEAMTERSTWALIGTGALSLTLAGILAVFLFYNVMERRVSDERLAASRALGELDARLLATTQQALSEQRKSASEREILLREIYHRVKNNLQIVQSLLRLGSRDLRDDQREPFESAIRRIGAMAGVHSLLYKSPDLASIDFKDYLRDVVRETAEGFESDLRGIRTEIEAQSMRVPLDTAVPLAFITVEILTNAFKHAFPNHEAGVISVTVRQEGDRGVLTIADNGVGVPLEAGPKRPLGIALVDKLIEQIGGTLEAPPPGQSTYRVTFPLTAPQQSLLPETAQRPGPEAGT
jgi:two-component sensor histidine kinase